MVEENYTVFEAMMFFPSMASHCQWAGLENVES